MDKQDPPCEQGNAIKDSLRDFVACVKKEIYEDRLHHQKKVSELVTEVKLQTLKITVLTESTEKENKECTESRKSIHSRINNIWKTGVTTLLAIIGWFVIIFLKNHNNH